MLVMCTMFVRFFLMIFGICGMFWLLISLLTEETEICTKRNKPKGDEKDVLTNANKHWFKHFKQPGSSSPSSRRGPDQNESDDESVASSKSQSTLNSVLLSQTSLAMMCDDENASQANEECQRNSSNTHKQRRNSSSSLASSQLDRQSHKDYPNYGSML